MSEDVTVQPESLTEVTEQPAAMATARRRAPKQDATLAQAVELARQAVVESAGAENVGEHLGIDVHEDRLLTHLFDCTMAGYPGWTWFATVARAPRTKLVTVCEVGLLAGEKSLLAPEWVPWEERMQAVNEQNQDEEQGEQDSENEDEDERESPTSDNSESSQASENSDSSEQTQKAESQSFASGDAPAATEKVDAPESGADSVPGENATAADTNDQNEASS